MFGKICAPEDLKVASQRYAYQFLSFPINYRFFISILFSLFPEIDILMAMLQMVKKKLSAFCSGMRKLKSLQQIATFLQTWEHIVYTFHNYYEEVNFRYISYKSSVLTIFQFKEVPFLRFKLLAFLSPVSQAIFPLRLESTQKRRHYCC